MCQNLYTIVQYIKNSIDIIVNTKIEEELYKIKKELKNNDSNVGEWEKLLIKEEETVRLHIANEHQLKIELDKYIQKLEELKNDNFLLSKKIKKFKDLEIRNKELEKQIKNLNKIIKNYEEEKQKLILKGENLKNLLKEKEKEINNNRIIGSNEDCSPSKIGEKGTGNTKSNKPSSHEIIKISPKDTAPSIEEIKRWGIANKSNYVGNNCTLKVRKCASISKIRNNNNEINYSIENGKNNSTFLNQKNSSCLYKTDLKKGNFRRLTRKKSDFTNYNLNNSQILQDKIKVYDRLDLYTKLIENKTSFKDKVKNNCNSNPNYFASNFNNNQQFPQLGKEGEYINGQIENELISKNEGSNNHFKKKTDAIFKEKRNTHHSINAKNMLPNRKPSEKVNIIHEQVYINNYNGANTNKTYYESLNGNLIPRAYDNSLKRYFYNNVINSDKKI